MSGAHDLLAGALSDPEIKFVTVEREIAELILDEHSSALAALWKARNLAVEPSAPCEWPSPGHTVRPAP